MKMDKKFISTMDEMSTILEHKVFVVFALPIIIIAVATVFRILEIDRKLQDLISFNRTEKKDD